jgi:hypothetical protein
MRVLNFLERRLGEVRYGPGPPAQAREKPGRSREGEVKSARLEYWSDCSARMGHSIYATRHIFVCHVATSGDELRGITLLGT